MLNQPFSYPLLKRLWNGCSWRYCADGGANRLHDPRHPHPAAYLARYLPDLIKGDLDSLRSDVREYYTSKNITVVEDHDQYSTDLMKCISALAEREKAEGMEDSDLVILGGLSGRLDQTVHTLSFLHKLRKSKRRVFAITDDSVAWVLPEGEHRIHINHDMLGPTCGLLPLGVDSTILSTTGLRWNLTDTESSFDGLVSTSNHLVPEEDIVWVKTSRPIWWTAELRASGLAE
ncbi:hypothetical protein IEO21_04462 [Rhodonia placenta]|uniref:Thiamine pyrophosphokinase n=1 Tax=Rhodonia placenta TaxID=104341 RepID=A0A8H7U366_9APHY|nr:hypothetical protein IEO21_04462 [Postia placenta]